MQSGTLERLKRGDRIGSGLQRLASECVAYLGCVCMIRIVRAVHREVWRCKNRSGTGRDSDAASSPGCKAGCQIRADINELPHIGIYSINEAASYARSDRPLISL